MTTDTQDIYLQTVKQITQQPFHYLSINPTNGLRSLEQFRFLIKKSMRDYSKSIGIHCSHQYLKYVSVIEVNPSITQGTDLFKGKFPKKKKIHTPCGVTEVLFEPLNIMDEMGYHTHLFLTTNQQTHIPDLRRTWTTTFHKQGIQLNWYDTPSGDIQSLNRFVQYHTKQIKGLDKGFLVTNT